MVDPEREQNRAQEAETAPLRPRRRSRVRRWLMITGVAVAIVAVALTIAVEYALHHAGPILRSRVIASLEDRFRSPVELDTLNIAFDHGIEVSGGGLRILNFDRKGPAPPQSVDQQPMLSVESFDFHTTVRQLLEPKMRIDLVHVRGMTLNLPPKAQRGPMLAPRKHKRGQAGVVVDKILCSDMTLTIETDKPDKLPLVFIIHNLKLKDIGTGRPFAFDARLVNPKPVGDIHSSGQFGPWNSEEPRDTPLEGEYSFTNADLGPIKGVAGILSSTGKYGGTLSEIGVTGTTETPNFSLDVSDRPVPLETEFDATVDGTTGDTRLNHVHATLLHTVLDVTGMVMQANDKRGRDYAASHSKDPLVEQEIRGHYIDLTVVTHQARIEDILTLGVKASPPIMRGALALQAHLAIPPGDESVSKKIRIQGHFGIRAATFSNAKWQETLDRMSARSEGHPKLVSGEDLASVNSQMSGTFSLDRGRVNIPDLLYQIPGAKVNLAGSYGLDGHTVRFTGTVQTKATASQMLTGWKHWVAKPFDRLFEKDGAGLEVPVTITGTKSDIQFGVDKGKLRRQIFSRHKDTPEVKTQDDKIAGDPERIRHETGEQKAEGPNTKDAAQQQRE